jgi:hypothetical protein
MPYIRRLRVARVSSVSRFLAMEILAKAYSKLPNLLESRGREELFD